MLLQAKAMPWRHPGRNMFKLMKNSVEKWWYFEFDKNRNLRLADKNDFKHRPSDANPDQGNPYTPWYELEDHYNNEHIHIKAINYSAAFKKATKIKEKNETIDLNSSPSVINPNGLRQSNLQELTL